MRASKGLRHNQPQRTSLGYSIISSVQANTRPGR
jgi:hypothetical protein